MTLNYILVLKQFLRYHNFSFFLSISQGQVHLDPIQFADVIERIQQDMISQQMSENQAVKSLEENCRKLQLAFHGRTPADGNCFYNAVSDQLDLLGLQHQSPSEIRQSVVKFLRCNSSIQVLIAHLYNRDPR